ncbi:MAG: diguanylate cyclase [Pseudomonadota bacterium]
METDGDMHPQEAIRRTLSQSLKWLDKLPTRLVAAVGMLQLLLIGVLDHFTGYEFSFSVFYLIPIALVSRRGDMKAAILISVLGAVTWLIADFTSGHPYSHTVMPTWNTLVRLAFFLIVAVSLVRTRLLIESLKESTQTDILTGMANSRGFRERALREMKRAVRYNRPLSVAYVDLDNFKEINDTFGHSSGDELLVNVATVLRSSLRNTDLVARLGGDEFAVLLPETRPKLAQRIIGRLQSSLSKELAKARGGMVTASIGTVTFLSAPKSVDEMIQRADRVMYEAKKGGKNDSLFETYPTGSTFSE